MKTVRALVLTGYGLNCDYETDFSLKMAGAESRRLHINELIRAAGSDPPLSLEDFHLLVFGGGFSWGDDHGAGVLMASKLRRHLGEEIERFIRRGNLIIGICNGFQALVNFGLLPGFDGHYQERRVALINNDSGRFIDAWVRLRFNPESRCVFTAGLTGMDLPVRHGEGKFYAVTQDLDRLFAGGQVAAQYADPQGNPAGGTWPLNPNGSLRDIAAVCDASGRVFGIMPHPEAFNHFTNHPDWTMRKEELLRAGRRIEHEEGDGIRIFRNAVEYLRKTSGS